MKKILFITAFVFISLSSFSQDIISLKKGGRRIEATITEITPTLVRYRLFSEPNGKIYFTYKDDISGIIYKNGKVETFDQPNEQRAVSSPKVNENQPTNSISTQQQNVETITKQQNVETITKQQNVETTVKQKNIEPVKKQNVETVNQTTNQVTTTKTTSQTWSDDKNQSDKEIYYSLQGKNSKPIPNRDSQNVITLNEGSEFHSGYRGIIDFGYYFGLGNAWDIITQLDIITQSEQTQFTQIKNPSHFDFHFINGIQLNPYFFVGIGTGVHVFMKPSSYSYPNGLFILPIFANFRVNFTNSEIAPYASIDLGYSLNIKGNSLLTKNKISPVGALGGATLGVNFRITDKLGIHVGANYQAQLYKLYFGEAISNANLGAIGITAGVSF